MENLVIGIDVGGTKIAAGLIDRNASFIARGISHSHCGSSPDQVVDEIDQIVQRLLATPNVDRSSILGVGVGISGHVHGERGIVMTNSNLPDWDYYPLRDTLKHTSGSRSLLIMMPTVQHGVNTVTAQDGGPRICVMSLSARVVEWA